MRVQSCPLETYDVALHVVCLFPDTMCHNKYVFPDMFPDTSQDKCARTDQDKDTKKLEFDGTNKPRLVLQHPSRVQSVGAYHQNKLLVTADEHDIRLWSAVSGACLSSCIHSCLTNVSFDRGDLVVACATSFGARVYFHKANEPLSENKNNDHVQVLTIYDTTPLTSQPRVYTDDHRVTSIFGGTGHGAPSVWPMRISPRLNDRRPPYRVLYSHNNCITHNEQRVVLRSFESTGALEVRDYTDDCEGDKTAKCKPCDCVIL